MPPSRNRAPEYDPDTGDRMYSVAEVAAMTGLRPGTLRSASKRDDTTARGRLPRATVNLKGKTRYRSSVISAWQAAHQPVHEDS